ncbi:MAG: ABC transporter permease [Clostridiales bacterium]|nr:ABC transporter permease [Clostridiales bacterium]
MQTIDKKFFEPVGVDITSSEAISRPSLSYLADAWRRLKKNKVAIACLIYILFIVLGSIFFPMISGYTMSEQHQDHGLMPMFYTHTDADGSTHYHFWGTDKFGRDMFTRVWYGARISMTIGVLAALINLAVGALYGGISGFFGGRIDNALMRIVEIINGIPYMIVVILLLTVLQPGIGTIVLAYAATGWTGMARLVRGQVLQQREQEYVLSSRVLGASSWRLIFRHLLPNCMSVIIIQMTLTIPGAIFTEAFLSYIGLGVRIPLASWGTLCNDGAQYFRTNPSILFLPAFFICLTMLSFNLLGDALRDVLDPRMRK